VVISVGKKAPFRVVITLLKKVQLRSGYKRG